MHLSSPGMSPSSAGGQAGTSQTDQDYRDELGYVQGRFSPAPFVSPVDRSPYMSSELTGLQSPVAREWMLTQLCFPVVPPGVGGGCCWNNLVFAWTYQLDI